MRRIFAYALLSILAVAHVGSASASFDVVEEQNGRLVVDVRFDEQGMSVLNTPGLPPLRYERFYVALPTTGRYRVARVDGVSQDRRGDLPEPVVNRDPPGAIPTVAPGPGFFPERPVVVSAPFVFRKTRVIAVDCYSAQVDYGSAIERRWPGYRVEVSYTPLGAYVPAEQADPFLSNTVINQTYLPVPVGGAPRGTARSPIGLQQVQNGVPDPHFSLSPNWIKIRVTSAGVYAIRGADLSRIGVDPATIGDPESFRLFTLGGREQQRRDDTGKPFEDPNGTWRSGSWMTECDILVEYGEDAAFHATDRIIFYAVGSRGWTDAYESGAPREAYHDHSYTVENVYYLTWDDAQGPGFPGDPRRMVGVGAAPSLIDPDMTYFEERLYFEENRVEALSYGGDGYLWIEVAKKNYAETFTFRSFTVRDLVPARLQTFRTVALAPYRREEVNENHHAVYLMNGEPIEQKVFDNKLDTGYDSAVPVVATGMFLHEGSNLFKLNVPRIKHPDDFMYFDFYEVFYPRQLNAFGDRLLFSSPDTTGLVNFRVANFPLGVAVYLLDVTDQFHPRIMNGFVETDSGGRKSIRFSSDVGANRQYYAALATDAFREPSDMERYFPRDLRDVSAAPDMLIVCHSDFLSEAERLRRHREANFPFSSNPTIEVVTTEDVFDNFSGGLVDPMGIRNYCKFLYDNYPDGNGFPVLSFLLLLGDANVDAKNYTTQQENFVTTNLNLQPYSSDAYGTDDWFVEMEPPDSTGASFIQIAVGRLPAGSRSAASFLVGRVIDFETVAGFGTWRDRTIIVADDEVTPAYPPQPDFVTQSESIATGFMAPFLEPKKIYLTEYPFVGSIKPASRLDFLKAWNEGALIINFIGHGSSAQMADEQVFLGSDVANLRNGLRLPLFMAFSCTIGDFGRAQTISLSEKLLLWEAGGAVAAISASEVSFIHPNASLNLKMFQEFSPREPGPPLPLGVALLKAKTGTLVTTNSKRLVEENNQKYNLLGDPTLQLASPRRAIVFDESDVDTMTTGKRQKIRGAVYKNGEIDTGFSGNVHLIIREPDDATGYQSDDGVTYIQYRYPRGTVYQGSANVASGKFEFNIKIPRFAGTGPLAFARAYADNGLTDAVALSDTTYFASPSPDDSTVFHPLDGSPRVEMGFKGRKTIVKPGAVLEATVNDADGVNILNTTPAGKIALVFDQTNLPIDVTEFFEYDHGGTDTSGTLSLPLPGLSVGEHRVILKVGDSFGQVTLDTLLFSMTDPLNYAAEVVLNYPNPFATSTYFLLNLTDRADVELDIFTVSGKRIRKLRETEDAGEAWIFWDGKDSVGDMIANGTYLYVARVSFMGLDRPPVVLRGKVVKIE